MNNSRSLFSLGHVGRVERVSKPQSALDSSMITRSINNPIIRAGMNGLKDGDGDNINGPSLIRVPDWVQPRLAKYYLYFSHHKGKYIRLAYAEDLHGPWTIHPGGALHLTDTTGNDHIASPDVHIDGINQRIVMYFHAKGTSESYPGHKQLTYVACSPNGVDFSAHEDPIGPFYFRVFKFHDKFYAVAKNKNKGGLIMESDGWMSPFRIANEIIPRMRHAAVFIKDENLHVFYTRIGDKPERILLTQYGLHASPEEWEKKYTQVVALPEKSYEGNGEKLRRSTPGMARNVRRELRDPAVYVEDEKLYLLYSSAGEQGICMSEYTHSDNSIEQENVINELAIHLANTNIGRKFNRLFDRVFNWRV